jgi:hypothetical protein
MMDAIEETYDILQNRTQETFDRQTVWSVVNQATSYRTQLKLAQAELFQLRGNEQDTQHWKERAEDAEKQLAEAQAQHAVDQDAIDHLKDFLAEAQAQIPQWIPVEERLPEKETTDLGEEYLVMVIGHFDDPAFVCPMNFDPDNNGVAEWFTGGWSTTRQRWNHRVTHWMPLPAAKKP